MPSSPNEFDKLRIPFQDVELATNNFAAENLIKEGGTANVYRGKLLDQSGQWTDVAVRRVLTQHQLSRDEFLEEAKALSGLKDKNIISIVGFCDENDENIIIMEFAVKGSLDQYLSDPTLTWSQRLKICLGATRVYLRMTKIPADYTYTYRDISCSKILLDKDGEAKISFFGLAKNKYGDLIGYPLGLIYLQLLYGREAVIGDQSDLTAMADHGFLKEKLDAYIDNPTRRKQIHPLSFSIFLKTAYDCLTDRFLYEYLYKISNGVDDALEVQLRHEYIEQYMGHLKIPLREIEVATGNFSKRYLIDSEPYEKLYKAELGPLERKSMLTIEGFDNSELFKRQITVVIQCILYEKKRRAKWFFQGFEMLTSCKHHNIVSLLGFFWEGSRMILVFEYPLNKSLRDYLGSANNISHSLIWEQRVHISLGIAHGLNYICNMEDKLWFIKHRGMTSASVLLDDNWNAKIASIKLGKRYENAHIHNDGEGSFIYSFGVLLFEILFGRSAEDAIYLAEKAKGHAHIPPSFLDQETQLEMVDQDSLDAFSKIAYQCLNVVETQAMHLTMAFIIKELEKALKSRLEHVKSLACLKIPLSKIQLATNNFDERCIIGSGGYGYVYKGKLDVCDGNHSLEIESECKCELPRKCKIVAMKRISIRQDEQGKEGFLAELNVLSKCEHHNIVSLLGYCDEDPEMILVYEYVANGGLDDFLKSTNNKEKFTWSQRLKICLDIANGIDYLHSTTKNKECVIHRDIKSGNILLDDSWEVKIADFGLSKLYPKNQSASTIITNNIAGTDVYIDPTYERKRMLNTKSDIYSFGVVLFEILTGKLAYDETYTSKDTKGLAPIARTHFKNGTLKEMVDPEILKEAHEVDAIIIGPSQDSLDTFFNVARRCIEKAPTKRPTIKDIIKKLQKALSYQEYHKKILKISLENIKMGTENFSDRNCITKGEHWKLYRGEIQNHRGCMSVFIKRLSKSSPKDAFLTELEILYKHKHENIIGVVGYCIENGEKIIVYEHAFNGSLCMHLNKVSLGWIDRLKICIDIATGLHFLHEGGTKEMVLHRDIKSSSILLNANYKAKISDFGYSLITPVCENKVYVNDHFIGTLGYCQYAFNTEVRFFCKEFDIYSLGVVLFEILSGRLTVENYTTEHCYLYDSVMKHFGVEGKHDELVFQGIKKQIAPESLTTFQNIAYRCLHHRRHERPTAFAVVVQLQKALEIQKNYIKMYGEHFYDHSLHGQGQLETKAGGRKKEELYATNDVPDTQFVLMGPLYSSSMDLSRYSQHRIEEHKVYDLWIETMRKLIDNMEKQKEIEIREREEREKERLEREQEKTALQQEREREQEERERLAKQFEDYKNESNYKFAKLFERLSSH